MDKLEQQFSETADTSRDVRDFYDQHPYPLPVDNLDNYRQLWQDRDRLRAEHHLFWPSRPYQESIDILIAGCGTSQAARYALRYPESKITGIDVSLTSIDHTLKLKNKYNLTNLQVHKLPIESVHKLNRCFDQIICTGVLHHLPDPKKGLKELRNVLKAEGAMNLMVYAPYGRTGIYMLQEYCRRLGIGHSQKDISELIEMLKVLPHGHPLENLLRQTPDFRYEAGLADALLHPQDRAYSVPQFFDFLKCGDFRFGRWIRQAPYLCYCGSPAKTPHIGRISNLSAPEHYTVIELLRGSMVRHSAVVYRDDNTRDIRSISFEDDDWPGYVPVRLSGTISEGQNLPPRASALLVNQNHIYTDIYLPVNKEEELLYESIDGKRNIAEIINMTSSLEDIDHANRFFQRLWHYDQVVFDTSQKS